MNRFLPWTIVGVLAIYVAAAMFRPPVRSPEGFDVGEFGRLPVLMNGRVQPIDSVARIGLLQIRGTVTVPREGSALGATEWLLELLTKPDAADARKVFAVRNPALLGALGLDAAYPAPTYLSFDQLEPRLAAIGKQALRISKARPADRAPDERELLKLRNALVIYERLKNSLQPNSFIQRESGGQPIDYDFAALLVSYQTGLRAGREAAVAREHGKEKALDKDTEDAMRAFARPFVAVSRAGVLAVIPPADPAGSRDRWESMGAVVVDSARTGRLPASVSHYAALSSAFAHGNPTAFNGEVAQYRQWLNARGLEPEAGKARYESLYNQLQPFVRATVLYLAAFVLACASRFRRSAALQGPAWMVAVVGWMLHAGGLLFEMMVEGRPPVTNVYSSIILAAAGAALVGLVFERWLRNGIGTLIAALGGLTPLVVAHTLAPDGGIELMRAALDTSFGLATLAILIAVALGRHGERKPAHSAKPAVEPRWSLRKPARILG